MLLYLITESYKQCWTKICSNTKIVGEFNTLLSSIDGFFRLKKQQINIEFYHTMYQMDLNRHLQNIPSTKNHACGTFGILKLNQMDLYKLNKDIGNNAIETLIVI